MDFLKNTIASTTHKNSEEDKKKEEEESGGIMSSISNGINTAAGGGKASEKSEDKLDKAVDFVQEHLLGQGPQDNESAVEQAKDEMISDAIRSQFQRVTGREIPIEDKPKSTGLFG